MVKGGRSIKSPLRSSTTKLVYGKFNIYYKQDKISTLKEVSVLDNFSNIKKWGCPPLINILINFIFFHFFFK